jgi:hypothetical protein
VRVVPEEVYPDHSLAQAKQVRVMAGNNSEEDTKVSPKGA